MIGKICHSAERFYASHFGLKPVFYNNSDTEEALIYETPSNPLK